MGMMSRAALTVGRVINNGCYEWSCITSSASDDSADEAVPLRPIIVPSSLVSETASLKASDLLCCQSTSSGLSRRAGYVCRIKVSSQLYGCIVQVAALRPGTCTLLLSLSGYSQARPDHTDCWNINTATWARQAATFIADQQKEWQQTKKCDVKSAVRPVSSKQAHGATVCEGIVK